MAEYQRRWVRSIKRQRSPGTLQGRKLGPHSTPQPMETHDGRSGDTRWTLQGQSTL